MSDGNGSRDTDGHGAPVDPPVPDMVPPPLLRQSPLGPDDFGQIVRVNGQSYPDNDGPVVDNMDWDHLMRISGWLQDLVLNNTMIEYETEREDVDSSGSESEDEDDDDNELYMELIRRNE